MALISEKFNDLRLRKEQLTNMLDKASGICRDLNMTIACDHLDKLGKKVNDNTFKMMVMGSFACGKSTFINALLGEEVLPIQPFIQTFTVKEVKYGEKVEAVLHFSNSSPDPLPSSIPAKIEEHIRQYGMKDIPPLHIGYSELKNALDVSIDWDSSKFWGNNIYQKVELYGPYDVLKGGLEIIEMFGLNETIYSSQIFMDYLEKSDAILFILSAERLCSMDEMLFIQDGLYEQGHSNILFVVNSNDLIPKNEREKVKRFAEMRLSEFCSNEISYISARQALDGQIQRNRNLYEESGMEEFVQRLSRFIYNQGKMMLSQATRELKQILDNEALWTVIPAQRAMLDNALDEIKVRYESSSQVEELKRQLELRCNKIDIGIEQTRNELRRMFRRHFLSITEDVPKWIAEYTPVNKIGIFRQRDRINMVAQEIIEFIAKKIQDAVLIWEKNELQPFVKKRVQYTFEVSEEDVPNFFEPDITVYSDAMKDFNSYNHPLYHNMICAPIIFNPMMEWVRFTGMLGISSSEIIETLKVKITEAVVNRINSLVEEVSDQMTYSVCQKMVDMKKSILEAMGKEIEQAEQLKNDLTEEITQGRATINARIKIIDACEAKIQTLNKEIDNFIFDLVELK